MRSTARLAANAGRSSRRVTHGSGYVCPQCQLRARELCQPASISASINRRAQRNASTSSNSVPFTEKLRRKIWGTDTPPGQEDPYANQSLLDRTNKKGPEVTEEITEPEAPTGVHAASGETVAQSEYVPATTWDGLEQIGGAAGWWEEAWDQEHQFRGFMSPLPIEAQDDIEKSIRRAMIEIFTLREAGRPLNDATNAVDDRVIPDISNVTLSQAPDGLVSIKFRNEQTRQDILDSTLKSEPVEAILEVQSETKTTSSAGSTNLETLDATPVQDIKPEDQHALAKPAHAGTTTPSAKEENWSKITLNDPTLKFAILKRTMQLTGRRIPDPAIDSIDSAKDLLRLLVKKPKPKKLADALLGDETARLAMPSNVQIFERRYTPIDKEKEVGRWKVVEKELKRRGLPVTGHT